MRILEEENEKLKYNQQTSDNSSMMDENSKLGRKLNICENVIEELKKDVCETSKLNEKLQYTLKTSDFINQEMNDDLKEQLFNKSLAIVKLVESIEKLNKHVKDQKEEIVHLNN